MADDTEPEPDDILPANDNQGPNGGRDGPDQDARPQVERVALTIARLIGRRIARDQFAALNAGNDNRPRNAREDGPDEE
jgi:hypothetical protein